METLSRVLRDWVRILGEACAPALENLPTRRTTTSVTTWSRPCRPRWVSLASRASARNYPRDRLDAYRWLYKPGFASRAFERGYEHFEAESPDQPGEGHRDVDLDAGTSPVGARTRLREFWSSGRAWFVPQQPRPDGPARRRRVRGPRPAHSCRPPPGAATPTGPTCPTTSSTWDGAESTALALDVFSAAGRQARRHYPEQAGRLAAARAVRARGPDAGRGAHVFRAHCGPSRPVLLNARRRPDVRALPRAGKPDDRSRREHGGGRLALRCPGDQRSLKCRTGRHTCGGVDPEDHDGGTACESRATVVCASLEVSRASTSGSPCRCTSTSRPVPRWPSTPW